MSASYSDILFTTTTDIPATAAVNRRTAFWLPPTNVAGAPHLTHFGMEIEVVVAGAATVLAGEMANAFNRFQVFIDGALYLDFSDPIQDPDATLGSSAFSVLMQSIGGTCITQPVANDSAIGTTFRAIWMFPIGLPLGSGRQRVEIVHEYGAFGGVAGWLNKASTTVGSGEINFIGRYGTATETLSIGSVQSFVHSASATQNFVVEGDANKGNMGGVFLANTYMAGTPSDNLGVNGIRVANGGTYSLDAFTMRVMNGNASNGLQGFQSTTSTGQPQLYESVTLGRLFLPVGNIVAGSNLTLTVQQDSTSTTRYYIPVFVKPIAPISPALSTQTAAKVTDQTASILKSGDV
jgi:hypothetical protein